MAKTKTMKLDEIKAEPGKAMGVMGRQAGRIKRLEKALAETVKLAEARLKTIERLDARRLVPA